MNYAVKWKKKREIIKLSGLQNRIYSNLHWRNQSIFIIQLHSPCNINLIETQKRIAVIKEEMDKEINYLMLIFPYKMIYLCYSIFEAWIEGKSSEEIKRFLSVYDYDKNSTKVDLYDQKETFCRLNHNF